MILVDLSIFEGLMDDNDEIKYSENRDLLCMVAYMIWLNDYDSAFC